MRARSFIAILIATAASWSALAGAPVPTASAPAAQSIRPLVVYSPHGPEILRLAREEFEKVAPGVKLDWHFKGAEVVLSEVLAEKGQGAGDVWWGGPQFMFMAAAKAGLLTPYQPSWSAKVDAAFRDEAHQWYGDQQVALTMIYNPTMAKPGEIPKDWDDLLAPNLKGRLVVRHPAGSGTMVALYNALIDRQLTTGRSLDEAFAWLMRFHGQVGRYVDHSQVMFSTVGKGLFPFGVWNISDTTVKRNQGYPVEFAFPASGMPILLDCIALLKGNGPKGQEHPAARQFYEMVTSAFFAERLAAEPFQRIPTRRDVAKRARPDYLDDPRFKRMEINWGRIAEQGTAWLERWQKETQATPTAH